MKPTDYPVVIAPLSEVANVGDAIAAWIEAATDMGRPIPAPSRRVAMA